MKKVLLITPGILPVPASMGGAAEYLTELYLTENDKYPQVEFDVATITYQKDVENLFNYEKVITEDKINEVIQKIENDKILNYFFETIDKTDNNLIIKKSIINLP